MAEITSPITHKDVGKYRVLLELGQGGTAHVHLAAARGPGGFNKLVVLKSLKRSIASDPEVRRMFLNEARLSARLNHPNVVEINEVTEHEGLPVIVMQYLEGRPLSDVIVRLGPAFSRAAHLKILCDAMAGLHYAHQLRDYDGARMNVIHRDMTPQNVFVTFDGQVKILDFGIAKLAGASQETQQGVIKGKLRYMPQEQIDGDDVDHRVDVYACGVMLWEAATGERLWRGCSDVTIMNRVINGEQPQPSTICPDIEPELEAIVVKAMAYERVDRYATVAELAAAVEGYLGKQAAVSSRDLAALMCEWFAEFRAETQQQIESQLSSDTSLTWDRNAPLSFPPSGHTQISVGILDSTGSADHTQRVVPGSTRLSRAMLALIGSALVVLGVAVWLAWPKPTPHSQVTAPSSVELRLTAFPAEAQLRWDERLLPSNPYTLRLPLDRRSHELVVTATGFREARRTLQLERDGDVVVSLERVAPLTVPQPSAQAPSGSTPTRKRAGPAAAATAAPAAPATDCNPPYFIDARGIKRYRPGCLL